MKPVPFVVAVLCLAGLIAACATEPLILTSSPPDYHWVQLGEDGAAIVRDVFKQVGQTCPKIEIVDKEGGKASLAMQPRPALADGAPSPAMPPHFDITVCEATITAPDGLQSASLAGKPLGMPTQSPQRIVVVGDTGCRINDYTQQNCNNNPQVDPSRAEDWLFTAASTSALDLQPEPDLVIYVGDYIYREAECTEENRKRCGGSPYGPKWATWEADFFEPARPLLEAVPWVFACGNHESCQREWRGWYLFFDPYPLTADSWSVCSSDQLRSEPFQIALDGLDLLVMDTADAARDLSAYQPALDKHTGSDPAWLITHQPLWGVGNGFKDSPPPGVIAAIQKANVMLLVSGHIHLFEMIQFDDGQSPPQMVAGGGATELDSIDPAFFTKTIENDFGANANNSEVLRKFTFVLVEVKSGGWHITVIDEDGTPEKRKFDIADSSQPVDRI